MSKLLLFGVVLLTAWLPARAARDVDPRRGLRRALLVTGLGNALLFVVLLWLVPRLAR